MLFSISSLIKKGSLGRSFAFGRKFPLDSIELIEKVAQYKSSNVGTRGLDSINEDR